MEYRKKIVKRILIHIVWMVIMLVLSAVAYIVGDESIRDYMTAFAIALTVATAVRIASGIRLLRDEEMLKKREIAEKDERNLSIVLRAKGWTFGISVFAACVVILVLGLLNMQTELKIVSYCLCFVVVVYYFTYLVLQRNG